MTTTDLTRRELLRRWTSVAGGVALGAATAGSAVAREPSRIACGGTVRGRLSETDRTVDRVALVSGDPGPGAEWFHDRYALSLDGSAGVTVAMADATGDDDRRDRGGNGDPYLLLLDANGNAVAHDDGASTDDARIDRPLDAGSYTVVATSVDRRATFPYRLSVECATFTYRIAGRRVRIPSAGTDPGA